MSFVCTCVVKSPQTALNFSPYSMPGTHGVSPWKASHSEKQIVKPQEGRCKAAGRRWWSFVGHQSQSCDWMRPHVVHKAWEAWGCQHCKDATSFLELRYKRDGKDGLWCEKSGLVAVSAGRPGPGAHITNVTSVLERSLMWCLLSKWKSRNTEDVEYCK